MFKRTHLLFLGSVFYAGILALIPLKHSVQAYCLDTGPQLGFRSSYHTIKYGCNFQYTDEEDATFTEKIYYTTAKYTCSTAKTEFLTADSIKAVIIYDTSAISVDSISTSGSSSVDGGKITITINGPVSGVADIAEIKFRGVEPAQDGHYNLYIDQNESNIIVGGENLLYGIDQPGVSCCPRIEVRANPGNEVTCQDTTNSTDSSTTSSTTSSSNNSSNSSSSNSSSSSSTNSSTTTATSSVSLPASTTSDLLLKSNDGNTIYRIVNNKKYVIVSLKIFNDSGYKMSMVKIVDQKELDKYASGGKMDTVNTKIKTTTQDQNHTTGLLKKGNTVYKIIGHTLRLVPNLEVFKAQNLQWSKVQTVSDLSGYTIGKPLNKTNILKVVKTGNTVWLLEGKTKRPFGTLSAFQSYGVSWNAVKTVATNYLDKFTQGTVIQ